MNIELKEHQIKAINKLRSGSILKGGVGSGKSITSLVYYDRNYSYEDLYIITTAEKRNKKEWEADANKIDFDHSFKVDSWNNIGKYENVKNAFFIFDEQRVVGYGKWGKTFIKIARNNNWILLTATPGDNWMQYMPVFVAHGFYKGKTDFVSKHVIYSRFTKYPSIIGYMNEERLYKLKEYIIVDMPFDKPTRRHELYCNMEFDRDTYKQIVRDRFNPYRGIPIKQAGELCMLLRRVVNGDESRINKVLEIFESRKKLIIFYNFNYELSVLKQTCEERNIPYGELNGHQHTPIPSTDSWWYLVQYTAGAEGWNCILTDTIIFYSMNHSYKLTEQSMGRIDRMNTPFKDLYYYIFTSQSSIDRGISQALRKKKDFNLTRFEQMYAEKT